MKRSVLIALVLVTTWGYAGAAESTSGGELHVKPLLYPELSRFLEARYQVLDVYHIRFQRDSAGSKLFVSFDYRAGTEPAYRTLVVTGEAIKELPGNPRVWYGGDQENPVFRLTGAREWYVGDGKHQRFYSKFEDATYVFKNSTSAVPFHAVSVGIKGVTGGDLVVLNFRDSPFWIVATSESPRDALVTLPKDLDHPHCAFANNRKLIVFGTWRPPPKADFIVKCLIYDKTADGYRLSEEIPMSWANSVYDLDLESGDAIIAGRGQFASYYKFNINTKKRARLGFAPSDDILFLQKKVIRTLEAALGQRK